jgi:peptidoglycan-N-acetylglucosamine deacetylase
MSLMGDGAAPGTRYSERVNVLASVVSGVTAMAAIGAVAIDHGLHRRSDSLLDSSVHRGPVTGKVVALTFDDGPGPQTLELLAYLASQEIPATFFQCGMFVERYPEITRKLHAAGHEIANHTWSHKRLSPGPGHRFRLPAPSMMFRELARTQRVIQDACGVAPRLFRPPYGKRWIGLDAVLGRLGLRNVLWTVIGHDWEWPAQQIAAYVLDRCVPGAIICLHDGRDLQSPCDISETLAALRLIVPVLREQGFQFETVSGLLAEKPVRVAQFA